MRSSNEYTRALSLEVLISHVIEKPKSEWKCYTDLNASTLQTTDKNTLLKLIAVLADSAEYRSEVAGNFQQEAPVPAINYSLITNALVN
jgi:hypothetical protein